MATRIQILAIILSLCKAAFAQSDFPTVDELLIDSYSTEVQITDVTQAGAAYATESYTNEQGSVKVYFKGDTTSLYYDNSTYQITEVKGNNCTVSRIGETEYDYTPLYYGWLNKEPFRLGPSAPLWYAQTRRSEIVKKEGTSVARNINCDLYTLPVVNQYDNFTIEYYFAPKGWTTPYKSDKLRIPIRIRIVGVTSRYSVEHKYAVPVEQINDFAYFKPSIEDLDLVPPVGLGCRFKAKAEDFPEIPETFQYSAEVVNILAADPKTGSDNVEIQFQKSWYDYEAKLARLDIYSMKNGYRSFLLDFHTGTMYRTLNNGSCNMLPLRDRDYEIYDYGSTSRMMEPKEALFLDGKFYSMGKREYRGLSVDSYESVEYDAYFKYQKYYKLVVTAYFTDSLTYVGVDGTTESRIPVYVLVTGYSTPEKKVLQLQHNIFSFDRIIYPEMYTSFRLDQCYKREDSKSSILLILNVNKEMATFMEKNAQEVEKAIRTSIVVTAKIPPMRIPYLKVDYKSSGVYIRAVLLDRPPAQLQFFKFDHGAMTTHDPDLRTVVEAKTIEQCSYACVDNEKFLCKGFYFCNQACLLKSTDIMEQGDGEETKVGDCLEYIRDEIDSTNFRQSYLTDALGFLETAILNKSMEVKFKIDRKSEDLIVSEIIIGDGPYTGVDMADKPYKLSIEDRRLDATLPSVKKVPYTGTLQDCFKRCKEAGSECSSFSFCSDYKDLTTQCLITPLLVMQDIVKDSELKSNPKCNIYRLKFLDLYTEYPEKTTLLEADKYITSVESKELCAKNCRLETDFTCRGFEYCGKDKTCSLHKMHILNLKPGQSGERLDRECTHYAARYIADYQDLGHTLIDDKSSIRYDVTLDDCAQICSEEQATNCNSFNFCPGEFGRSTCSLSKKLLRDADKSVPTFTDEKCTHYEKRDSVHDWDNSKAKTVSVVTGGYTKKGFTGLVIGMLVLGLIVGALAFVLYSYVKSRNSNDGSMAVRFMKSDS